VLQFRFVVPTVQENNSHYSWFNIFTFGGHFSGWTLKMDLNGNPAPRIEIQFKLTLIPLSHDRTD